MIQLPVIFSIYVNNYPVTTTTPGSTQTSLVITFHLELIISALLRRVPTLFVTPRLLASTTVTQSMMVFWKNPSVVIITRWRLSNHNLHIETGRRTKPAKTPREIRTCMLCNVIEDEDHVVFMCTKFECTRIKFNTIYSEYHNIKEFLNPRNMKDARLIGSILTKIEDIMQHEFDQI